jgi:hypothetical protein
LSFLAQQLEHTGVPLRHHAPPEAARTMLDAFVLLMSTLGKTRAQIFAFSNTFFGAPDRR